MPAPLLWITILALYALPYGWARRLAARSAVPYPQIVSLCLTLVFSTGGLSLIMLALGLLGLPIRLPYILGVYLPLMALGYWPFRRGDPSDRPYLYTTPSLNPSLEATPFLPTGERVGDRGRNSSAGDSSNRPYWWIVMGGIVAAIALAVMVNALLWPFYNDDTRGIYAPMAAEIAQTGALVPITPQRNLYELYPQLNSMNYALVDLLAGWQNPYLARGIAAVLSLAVLPATFLLGAVLSPTADHRMGAIAPLLAVVVLTLTPDFVRWASTGYVDLPMAFFYALAAVFTWALIQHGRPVDALLGGLCLGLAAWTKNAALLGVLLLGLILVYRLMMKQIHFNNILLYCSVCALVILAWYGRNWLLVGQLIPDTIWTEDARQTLREVFILITLPQNYGAAGGLMLAGAVWAGVKVLFQKDQAAFAFLLWISVPYYLTWLFYASYDPRFLLLILPPLAVMAASWLAPLFAQFQNRRLPMLALCGVVVVLLVSVNVWRGIEYKRVLWQHGWMSHEQKLVALSLEAVP
jgi:hypothetical protein